MCMFVKLSKLIILVLFSFAAKTDASPETVMELPGCDAYCGDIRIPYPFGMTIGCYLNKRFHIRCDRSSSPPKALIGKNNHLVTYISVDGELHIQQFIAKICYNKSGEPSKNSRFSLSSPEFAISSTRNMFTAMGCDTLGIIAGSVDNCSTGCMTKCHSIAYVPNGTCSGIGCCQTSIPKGLNFFEVNVSSFNNHRDVWDFNPCSYAFVVEKGAFTFSSNHLRGLKETEKFPVVLEWAIGNETCDVSTQKIGLACYENSVCRNSDNGPGYRCYCKNGYHGNPYLPGGCRDINECDEPELNQCVKKCDNSPGGYSCSCPKGYHGKGRKDGEGCIADRVLLIELAVGISVSATVLLAGCSFCYWIHRKRKLIKLKEKFFRGNGGLMLQQQLSGLKGATEMVKIYSSEELEKATNKYDHSMVVGRGGFGTVYKGILSDNTVVAIKKSKVVDQSQIEQFINEVVVLSQINHRNVVKLLGCCLETEVPLLVYEFINNGTVFDHIHNTSKVSSIAWESRLRIAAETAGVLSYLHSAASIPIIHRDVKSSNILLDKNYTAKVSDFGASRLVPMDQSELSTLVQGTLGYLDPEYLHTSQLNEKSDVYSFGVILVELLTGEKALSFTRPEEERCLAMHFLSALDQNRLDEIVDQRIIGEIDFDQLNKFVSLAERCVRVKGEERPNMKQVAMELEGLKMRKLSWSSAELNVEGTNSTLLEMMMPEEMYSATFGR